MDILRDRPAQAEMIMNRLYSKKVNKSLKANAPRVKVKNITVDVVKPSPKRPRRVMKNPVRRILPTIAPPLY